MEDRTFLPFRSFWVADLRLRGSSTQAIRLHDVDPPLANVAVAGKKTGSTCGPPISLSSKDRERQSMSRESTS
ncbi:MAG TPA: hypothetical protein VGK08_07495, partial [Thermoanaerobaculia bacterium]